MILVEEKLLKILLEKVQKYEEFLHSLQLNAEVILNSDNVRQLIGNACRWSYAHRVGNGELSYEEQDKIISQAFEKLCEIKH